MRSRGREGLPRYTDGVVVVAWMSRSGAVTFPAVVFNVAVHVVRPGTAVVRVSAEGTATVPAGTHDILLRAPARGSLHAVGDGFLSRCPSLTSVDFGALSAVTTVGDDFLYRCTSLTSVDFGGLSAVTTVGAGFLEGCTSLRAEGVSGVPPLLRTRLNI